MANSNLHSAKAAKNDEFYTQFNDIVTEMNAYIEYNPNVFRGKTILLPCDDPEWSKFTNYFVLKFNELGLKKLISTSYAANSKPPGGVYTPTAFETGDTQFDADKSTRNGKIFTLKAGPKASKQPFKMSDLKWRYLEGDGDFRSPEVVALRDEADVIITNPPFSLFREFLAWIMEANKQFVIVGSMNAITYKEVFPLIKDNAMWLGKGFRCGSAYFSTSPQKNYAEGVYDHETGLIKFGNVCWFTNIEHGRRHQQMQFMTMADNLKFNKKMRGKLRYQIYDNYAAIEVPFVSAIPCDYTDEMGVPISFLNNFCPEQFEIVGGTANGQVPSDLKIGGFKTYNNPIANGRKIYQRIIVKHKKPRKVKQ